MEMQTDSKPKLSKKDELRQLQESYTHLNARLKNDVRKPLAELREMILQELERATYGQSS